MDSRVARANMVPPMRDGNDLAIDATNRVNGAVSIGWCALVHENDNGELQDPAGRDNTNAGQSLTGLLLHDESVDAGDIDAAWSDCFPDSTGELTATSADNLESASGARGEFDGPTDYDHDQAGNAGGVAAAMLERGGKLPVASHDVDVS